MEKTANINVRLSPDVKQAAELLFDSLGLTLAGAINIFLHKALMESGLPFEVKQKKYNSSTEAAIKEARKIVTDLSTGQINGHESVESMFESLNDED